MIDFRYLSREVLMTLSAVSAVLLVIIMSGRFIKYLAQAAQGVLDPGVLFLIMGYRMPGFLQLILPLGLFLGILLAYGRLYLDSEMTVLSATGMSNRRLLGYSMAPAAIVAVLVAWLSLGLAPQGVAEVAKIFNQQDAMTEFIRAFPPAAPVMGDLYAKSMDWPQAEEIGERLEELLPPPIKAKIRIMGSRLSRLGAPSPA